MMKKFVAMMLAAVMVLGLVACGAKEEAPAEEPAVEEEAPAEEEAKVESVPRFLGTSLSISQKSSFSLLSR